MQYVSPSEIMYVVVNRKKKKKVITDNTYFKQKIKTYFYVLLYKNTDF